MSYDPGTGLFRKTKQPGKPAGTINTAGYVVIRVGGKLHYAHRLAWEIVFREEPDGMIDHINGNKADNRICNLRLADDTINNHNCKSANKSNESCGLLGVTKPKHTPKWVAAITVNGRRRHIGYFDTAEEAHDAYLGAKIIHHPIAPRLAAS